MESDGLWAIPHGRRLDVSFSFGELRRKPVPLVIAVATARLTAAVQVEGGRGWKVWATLPSRERWRREFPAGEVGFLRKPLTVSCPLGRMAFPLAVLDALSRPERQAPGADLVALGIEGAVWECDGREYRFPVWAVLVFQGRPVPESLALLEIPASLHLATLAALPRPAEASAALPEADTVPAEVREEAVNSLHSLDEMRFALKRTRDLVDRACQGLSANVAAEDIVRKVLSISI